MSDPIQIREAKVEPESAVVELLEDLLTQAKAGELREIAVVTRVTGRCTGTAHVGELDGDPLRTIGALELLKQRILEGFER